MTYLTVKEASEYLHIKPSTLYGWVHEEFIPHYKAGGKVLFSREELDAWMKARHCRGRARRKINI